MAKSFSFKNKSTKQVEKELISYKKETGEHALIPTESIMQTYPELPYEQDANGTTVLKWDIVYDDAYNYALPTLLTLEKIKYKPIL